MILEQLQGSPAWPVQATQKGSCGVLPGGTGDMSGDGRSSPPVQRGTGAAAAHRYARAGVRGGLLDLAERHPAVKGSGDNARRRVRPDRLGDSGAAGQAADDPGGAVPVPGAAAHPE